MISFQHENTFRIRVYYQDTNDQIRELCRDNQNPWTQGAKFPVAVKGTSIASSSLQSKPNHIWLLFQILDLDIKCTFTEYLYQGSGDWKKGKPKEDQAFIRNCSLFSDLECAPIGVFKTQFLYNPGAYVSIASHGRDSHRVFTVTKDNKLAVTAFDGPANNWKPSVIITDQIPFGALGAIPVAGEGEPEPAVRIYNQRKASEITEWGTYDGNTYKEIIPSLPIS